MGMLRVLKETFFHLAAIIIDYSTECEVAKCQTDACDAGNDDDGGDVNRKIIGVCGFSKLNSGVFTPAEFTEVVVDVQVLNGALLQQTFVVEFTVHNQMCDDCHRVEAKDFWRSCVQVRQKVCMDPCPLLLSSLEVGRYIENIVNISLIPIYRYPYHNGALVVGVFDISISYR